DPDTFKHPNARLLAMLKETFGLRDDHFMKPRLTGEEPVRTAPPGRLPPGFQEILEEMVGAGQVAGDDFSRIRYSTGKTTEESLALRRHDMEALTCLVVHPRNKKDVKAVVKLCHGHEIPLSVYGGGSSVTLGHRMERGGVTLVMGTHMNRVLSLDEEDHLVTVEAGISGPEYEKALNHAPERFGASRAYTCGHFPQSFEFSSVGGWVLTLGSGQASSYYGDAADLLLAVEVVTPRGEFITKSVPGTATGPRIQDIFKGSEGAFGVLVSVTMKIFRRMPGNTKRFSFIFPDWKKAVGAAREMSQAQCGMPAVFRISDAEETDIALKLYGVEGGPLDRLMGIFGYRPMERCLLLGTSEGERGFSRNVAGNAGRIARQFGAMSLTSYPVKKWEHGRYLDPYMREDLLDFGIVIDTLETGVTWSSLHRVHEEVRAFIKKRPGTVCMTHASHFYPQGTNLYFIFMALMEDIKEYKAFHRDIIRRIKAAGGTLSHHHGVGRMMAPFMEDHIGKEGMGLLMAIKNHLDPRGIMGPGVIIPK
ncbi:MAG: FAD-binding oxidoreductase, partial [Desulfamplus sp.]|nr:FAD-binding oxidoreductase [Desulfamplus sp.]